MAEDNINSTPSTNSADIAPLPLNRLVHQIINPFHHSFKTKWHSIIIQIFGRYGLFESETTSISHCNIFNADVYRIHDYNKEKHLDPVKLRNPVKWIEFLIVAPLEMFSFSFLRLAVIIDKKVKSLYSLLKKKRQNTPLSFFKIFFILGGYILTGILDVVGFALGVTGLIVDLAVNLITGTVRRCLAPARYIVRPAIETAKKYPKSFASIVTITAIATLFFTMMVLTGGIPAAIVGSQFLAFTLAAKLTTISIGAIWLGSALTKGFNTVRELISVIFEETPTEKEQIRLLHKRNQQSDYPCYIIKMDTIPKIVNDEYKNYVPLFIRINKEYFIYSFSSRGEGQLKKLCSEHSLVSFLNDMDSNISPTSAQQLSIAEQDKLTVYKEIARTKIHYQKRTGSTAEITRSLQNIDPDNTDLKSIDQSNPYHRASLWLGIESLTHPAAPAPAPSPRH